MSDSPGQGATRVIPAGGGTQVIEMPPQTAYTLSELRFRCLLHGESAKQEERLRDVCVAVFITSVPAFLSMVPDLDTPNVSKVKFWIAFVYAVAAVVSGILALVMHRKAGATKRESLYAQTVNEIEAFFQTKK